MRFVFFFNDTATTEIYTYGHTPSRHDALPIWLPARSSRPTRAAVVPAPHEEYDEPPHRDQSQQPGEEQSADDGKCVVAQHRQIGDDADACGDEEQLQVPQQRVRGPQDVRGLRRTAYLQDDEEQHHPEHGTGHREVEAAGDHITDQLAAERAEEDTT